MTIFKSIPVLCVLLRFADAQWTIISDNHVGEPGCSNDSTIISGQTMTLEACKQKCTDDGAQFMSHHDSNWCSCLSYCPLTRPASDFGSKSVVYTSVPQTSAPTASPTDAPTAAPTTEGGAGLAVLQVAKDGDTIYRCYDGRCFKSVPGSRNSFIFVADLSEMLPATAFTGTVATTDGQFTLSGDAMELSYESSAGGKFAWPATCLCA